MAIHIYDVILSFIEGSQDGGVCNGRVCVDSPENLDLRKL